jgi:hypothetical protein
MALEFPHVEWTGVDLVARPHPHSPQHLHVKYETYDFTLGLRYKDATFDLVHARNTFQLVRPPLYLCAFIQSKLILSHLGTQLPSIHP